MPESEGADSEEDLIATDTTIEYIGYIASPYWPSLIDRPEKVMDLDMEKYGDS